MSRHGYVEDLDQQDLAMWRGRVASAIRGKRGQRLLRDIAEFMDAMPEKRLIRGDLVDSDGAACALGCAFLRRGMDTKPVDPEDPYAVAEALDISHALAKEVAYVNDDHGLPSETAEQTWTRVRKWIREHLREEAKPNG